MKNLLTIFALVATIATAGVEASAHFTDADGSNDAGAKARAVTFARPLSTRARVEGAAAVLAAAATDGPAVDAIVATLKARPSSAGAGGTLGDAGEVFEHLSAGGVGLVAGQQRVSAALGAGYDHAGVDDGTVAGTIVAGSALVKPVADDDAAALASLTALLGRCDLDGNVEGVDAAFDATRVETPLQTVARLRGELAGTIGMQDDAHGYSLMQIMRSSMAVDPEAHDHATLSLTV